MRINEIFILLLISIFALFCTGCVEDTNANNSSDTDILLDSNISSNLTNLTS